MRAYQLPKSGAGIEALAQVERPDPSKPGHRQVLVKVRACSLNFRDLGIVRGSYRMPVRENVIPLSDGAGEVVEVGTGVTRVKAGDRVAGNFFQRWPGGEPAPDAHTSALGGGIDGMLAEYAMLEEDGVVKIPAHLSLEEGATLPCAAVTVWNAMMEHARLKAGDTVLLQGTGGVSIFGLQFARAMGIAAIITSSSDEKLKRAKTLGAAHGINYKTTPDWEKAAVEFTGGRGVDHVVEVGGAATLTRSFHAIRVGGKITHDRRLERRRHRTQSRPDLWPPRQRAGHLRRLDADVHGHEPRHRSERDQAGDRQSVRLRRRASRLSPHGLRLAFREDRYPRRMRRNPKVECSEYERWETRSQRANMHSARNSDQFLAVCKPFCRGPDAPWLCRRRRPQWRVASEQGLDVVSIDFSPSCANKAGRWRPSQRRQGDFGKSTCRGIIRSCLDMVDDISLVRRPGFTLRATPGSLRCFARMAVCWLASRSCEAAKAGGRCRD